MPIQISITNTQIGLNINNASLSMSGNGNKPLDVRSEIASVDVTSQSPELIIDQSQCFAEAGLKDIKTMISEYAALGRQKCLQGTGQTASEGVQMRDSVKDGGHVIPRIAKSNAMGDQKQFGFELIPTSMPEIDLVRGEVNLDYHPSQVTNNTQIVPVSYSYSRGNVDVTIARYGNVDINYQKSSIDYQI